MAAPADTAGYFDGVVIVGAGLSGCSTAYHLALQGTKVLLLEAGVVGWGDADAEVEVTGPRFAISFRQVR